MFSAYLSVENVDAAKRLGAFATQESILAAERNSMGDLGQHDFNIFGGSKVNLRILGKEGAIISGADIQVLNPKNNKVLARGESNGDGRVSISIPLIPTGTELLVKINYSGVNYNKHIATVGTGSLSYPVAVIDADPISIWPFVIGAGLVIYFAPKIFKL